MKPRFRHRASRARPALTIICAAASIAGTARAQTSDPLLPSRAEVSATAPGRPEPWSIRPTINLSSLRAPLARPYAEADALQDAVLPRTAVDHRFASGGMVGSVGYLCGVNNTAPGASDGGPASSYGRGTTFLGAKLSLPFH